MEFNPSWLKSLTQQATAFPWTLGILRSFSIPFPKHCSRTTVEFQMDEVTKFHFMIAGIPLSPLHNAISIGQEPSSCARQEITWNWCQECYQSRLWRTLLKRSLERRFQNSFNPFSQRQAKGPEIVQWPKVHCQAFTLSFKSFFPAQMSLSVHWDDCNLWQFSVYVMRCLFHCYFDTRTKWISSNPCLPNHWQEICLRGHNVTVFSFSDRGPAWGKLNQINWICICHQCISMPGLKFLEKLSWAKAKFFFSKLPQDRLSDWMVATSEAACTAACCL